MHTAYLYAFKFKFLLSNRFFNQLNKILLINESRHIVSSSTKKFKSFMGLYLWTSFENENMIADFKPEYPKISLMCLWNISLNFEKSFELIELILYRKRLIFEESQGIILSYRYSSINPIFIKHILSNTNRK